MGKYIDLFWFWAFIGSIIAFFILFLFAVNVDDDILALFAVNDDDDLHKQILELELDKKELLSEINISYQRLYQKDLQCEVKLLNLTLEYQRGHYEQILSTFGVYN